MKVKVTETITHEVDSKVFQVKTTTDKVIYTVIVPDDDEDRVILYWMSNWAEGKLFTHNYSREYLKRNLDSGEWTVIKTLDETL